MLKGINTKKEKLRLKDQVHTANIAQELELLIKESIRPAFHLKSHIETHALKKDELKTCAEAIHTILIIQSHKNTRAHPIEISFEFDLDQGILNVRDQKIKVRKFSDQYHALRIVFENQKDLGQEWFFSDIAEKYDLGGRFDDKKFYNAIYQINQKLKIASLPDFFITTRQSAKINPKYLS